MKKLLGSLLLGMAALAMPLATISLSGCSGDVGKSEQIENTDEKHGEGHGEEFKDVMEKEKPQDDM